jgi:saccharopine dehydrogenase-like NADP-dependent oxidoreductase
VADVLILGAGLVTKPMVRHLLSEGFSVKVASRTVSKAERLVDGHPKGEVEQLLADEADHLEQLVAGSELTVSMLPWTYHPCVAQACLKHRKHLVTTSYVKEPMKKLDAEARAADLLFLNEIGLDPGIDHMSAMEIFHRVEANGGKIVSFRSYCGGLPAPEANTNPWGYKISWSPRSVALAGTSAARYRENGHEVSVPARELFGHRHPLTIEAQGLGTFEAYPNRDSLPYIDLYGLHDVHTMFRGTLRYAGWCEAWYALVKLGMLGTDERSGLKQTSAGDFLREVAGLPDEGDVRDLVSARVGVDRDHPMMDRFQWLGLFSDSPLPVDTASPMDVLVDRMSATMDYAPGERDMIILHHDIQAEYPDKRELICSTLADFGISNGDSSMSRTVSLPAAIATELILRGEIEERGVQIPVGPDIYEPIMARLGEIGIAFEETVHELGPDDDIEAVRCAR